MKRKRTALHSIQNWEFETQRGNKHPHFLFFLAHSKVVSGKFTHPFRVRRRPQLPQCFLLVGSSFLPFTPVVPGHQISFAHRLEGANKLRSHYQLSVLQGFRPLMKKPDPYLGRELRLVLHWQYIKGEFTPPSELTLAAVP